MKNIIEFLKIYLPLDLLMPCTKDKNPIFAHSKNQWNWDKVMKK